MLRSLTICRIVGMLSFTICLSGCFQVRTKEDYLSLTCTDLGKNVSEAVSSSSFTEGEYPSPCWWEMFHDPQLNQMIEMALSCHPTIEEARQRIIYAYEQAIEVRAVLLPYFGLTGTYARERESQYDIGIPALVPLIAGDNLWYNMATLLLKGRYEIDVWGKNRAQYYSQLGQLQGKVSDYAQVRLILSVQIAEAYFNLQSHLKQELILSKRLEVQSEVVTLMRQRYTSGAGDEFFPYITDTDRASYEDALQAIRGAIEIDRHALAALVGNVESLCGQELAFSTELSAAYEAPVPLPTSLPLNLIAHRPDIMASLWNIQSKGFEIKVAKARFFPNLDLFGHIGSVSFLITKFMTPGAFKFLGEAASTLPVYTGGELRARLGEAQADLDLAVASYNQTLLLAVQDVCDGITHLKTADERLKAVQQAVFDSLKLEDLTAQRYQNGIATRIALLNSMASSLNQQNLAEEIRLSRMIAIVEVIRALGGGYNDGC